jgi:uncharacterized protein YggE
MTLRAAPATRIALAVTVAVGSACVALAPAVRAQSAAADVPCAMRAYETIPTLTPPYAIGNLPTAEPTPAVQGTGAERTLSVPGFGSTAHAPDTVYVDVRLTTSGPDAIGASCANERGYDALRRALGAVSVTGLSNAFAFRPQTTSVVRAATPPPGASPQPAAAPVWYVHRLLRVRTTPARWRDVVTAVQSAHGTVTSVQFALNDAGALHELSVADALRDAVARAPEIARSQHAVLGPMLRIETSTANRAATSASSSLESVLETLVATPQPVSVRSIVTATFALGAPPSAAKGAAALIIVHPLAIASRPPELASIVVTFTDSDNDRAALLYRHESAYDALWAKLTALGVTAAQVPQTSPRVVANRPAPTTAPASPRPSSPPSFAFSLSRDVTVNAIPVAQLQQVVAAFAAAGGKSIDVTFQVRDRPSLVAASTAEVRRNGLAQARAIASAAGLRLVPDPYSS